MVKRLHDNNQYDRNTYHNSTGNKYNNKTAFFINKESIHDNKRKNNRCTINRQNSSSLKLLTCLLRGVSRALPTKIPL